MTDLAPDYGTELDARPDGVTVTDDDSTPPVRVIFRSFTEYGTWPDPDGVIALFPDIDEGCGRIGSYMHHGQYAPADAALIRSLYVTTRAQRAAGVAELEAAGYRVIVDSTAPGRIPRPWTPDGSREFVGPGLRTLRRNGDARAAVVDRAPFANRSHTFRSERVYVPVGARVERVDGGAYRGDGGADTVAHIRIVVPGDPSHGRAESTRTLYTGALPPVYVSALVRSLVELSRDPSRSHLYVVSSFDTPILWCDAAPGSPECVPPVRYSATTANHQRHAAGVPVAATERFRSGRTPFGTSWQTRAMDGR